MRLHSSFVHFIRAVLFNSRIFSMFRLGWFSLLSMTADCISCVWVHLAFSFSLLTPSWVRAPCEDLLHQQWSIFTCDDFFGKARRTCWFSRPGLSGRKEGWLTVRPPLSSIPTCCDAWQPYRRKQPPPPLLVEASVFTVYDFHTLPAWFF